MAYPNRQTMVANRYAVDEGTVGGRGLELVFTTVIIRFSLPNRRIPFYRHENILYIYIPRILRARIIEADTGRPCFHRIIIIAVLPWNGIKTIRRGYRRLIKFRLHSEFYHFSSQSASATDSPMTNDGGKTTESIV